jgi:hypothetical protein
MRVSLNRRLDRIREHYLPAGSLAWRLDRLPNELKQAYQIWSKKADAINSEYKKQNLNRYELLLAGCDDTPPMPAAVYRGLWGDRTDTITSDFSVAEAAEAYALFLEKGSTQ